MNFDPKKTIFLIDGSSFLYRAYYSMRPLHAPNGKPVQAVYGFVRMIKKIIDTFKPEYIALVWDSKGKTTRHEMFQEYKATRQAPPSDLFEQKEIILQFADLIKLKNIALQGVEADDIMYSLAQDYKKDGYTVVFITSDKDMSQAIDEQVFIFDPFKDEYIDKNIFQARRGFPVEKLPFYFAILGDTSDNIPGVKGIGEKGATDLVKQFESLKHLYESLDAVSKERTRALLLENKSNAFLSEKLFLLQYHPMELSKNSLTLDNNNWSNALPLFQELNFKSLLKAADPKAVQAVISADQKIESLQKYTFRAIVTEKDLHDLCFALKEYKVFGLDTETTGLSPLQDELVGISVCVKEGESWYIPVAHKTTDAQLPKATVIQALKPIFEDASIKKYLHHAKFDALVLWHAGIDLKGIEFDTCIAAVLVNRQWQRAGLKELSLNYFNEPMLTFEDVVKAKKLKDFSYVPLELATIYAAVDAHQTFRLKKVLEQQLKAENLFELFTTIEMPLIDILFHMERQGISIDVPYLKELNVLITARIVAIENEIIGFVGDEIKDINFNSPRQIEDLLFTKLLLPTQKKSAKRTGFSTDQEVLETLSKMHPVPGLLIKHRELSKLKSTYIESLPEFVNPQDHKIHTTFSQIAVATGRLASFEPNLQNIPVNDAGIRDAFKPSPGYVFLSADYSQIELRILAHVSGDKNLVNAFLTNQDIHAQTAAVLFGVPLETVTHEQRQVGKRINFSILYGLTPYGLSKDLHIPLGQAKEYIEKYFAQYPAVSVWMESVIDFTKKQGYVTTLWGRRRYVPQIHEKNRSLYEEARRVAINTVPQGSAADIMKLGMIALNKEFIARKSGTRMLLQIHDELLIEVPEHEKESIEEVVKNILQNVVSWEIPLIVTTRVGNNWHEVTK